MNEKSFVILSIYFLQPLLTFWGLMVRPIDWNAILIPVVYGVGMCVALAILGVFRSYISDRKDREIFHITGIISNTGNLGIPLGILIVGIESIPYTVGINLVNSLIVLTLGAFRYSRGNYSFNESFRKVIRLPICWVAILALIWQNQNWPFPEIGLQSLEMAAYTAMVIQLMIYGMYIADMKWQQVKLVSIVAIQGVKYGVFPIIIFTLIYCLELPLIGWQCLMLQAMMPIAINTINLSALYDCYPQKVALHVLVSSVVAFLCIPFYLALLFSLSSSIVSQ